MGRSGRRTQQFIQFQVSDDACGMKVGTDALILGSYAGERLLSQGVHPLRILDIGTGSGILALMLAQRFPEAHVDAIEVEGDAVAQARANVDASPFSDRITVHHCALQAWRAEPYDLIVSNPPFFHNHPKGNDPKRNLARHDDALPLDSLLKHGHQLLATGGEMVVIYPEDRADFMEASIAESPINLWHRIALQSSPNHGVIRSVWSLSSGNQASPTHANWIIEAEPLKWGPDIQSRLEPFVPGIQQG